MCGENKGGILLEMGIHCRWKPYAWGYQALRLIQHIPINNNRWIQYLISPGESKWHLEKAT